MERFHMLLAWAILAFQSTWVVAQTPTGMFAATRHPGADALLAIDQNRSAVVDRIMRQWGEPLTNSGAGLSAEQLSALLSGLRADHLLAASLAGNLEGLRNAISNAVTSTAAVSSNLLHTKALGDAGDDVVYTPVTPCRLVDTRNSFAAVYQNGGAFTGGEIRNYTIQGGNGVCLTQLPGGLNPSAVQLQVFGIPINGGSSGDVEILPQGSAFGSTATLVYLGNVLFTSASTTARINLVNNQIGVQVRGGGADVAIDVVGYFKAPSGTVQPSGILWVAPSGGNYTSIQAAINAAASLATLNNPYLVRIAPGVYTEQVTLKDFVDVEGSGERGTTTIQFGTATPTVTAGAYSELRNLAIVNTFSGASPGAVAIGQSANTANGNTFLRNVAVAADGPLDNTAIYVTGGFLNVLGTDVEAALSATQTGVEIALWSLGATSNVVVKNSSLNPESGATRLAARRDSGSLVRIENTQMKGTTLGTPLCFNNFVPSTYTLAACP